MSTFETVGRVERFDSALDSLIPGDAVIELLEVGFAWSEGPVWVAGGEHLLFSDIPRNAIIRWSERDGARIWMQPSGYTGVSYYGKEPGSNGLTLDSEGRLLACEHGDRRVSRLELGGGKTTIVDSYQGKRLNSPNDLVLRSNGDLYFTDPAYGLHRRYDDPSRELPFCGVFLVRAGEREAVLVSDELENPNGVAFDPEERYLYVTQSNPRRAVVMRYPLGSDGTLGPGEVLADLTDRTSDAPGLPDGIKVDIAGNIFTTGPGGVWVMTADGSVLGRVVTDCKPLLGRARIDNLPVLRRISVPDRDIHAWQDAWPAWVERGTRVSSAAHVGRFPGFAANFRSGSRPELRSPDRPTAREL